MSKLWKSGGNRPKVILDMDEVITSTLKSVIEVYNEKHKTHFKTSECNVWNLTEVFGCTLEEVMEIFRTPGFFENLEPRRGVLNTLKKLIKSAKYDIYICTATSDEDGSELVEKIAWFKKYLPEFNTKRIIACKDKYMIRGDVIVDDNEDNLKMCKPYMECILMDAPTNQRCNKYIRIKNMNELPDILEKMFYNENGGIKYFKKTVKKEMVKISNTKKAN